jgi:hypothetical protein
VALILWAAAAAAAQSTPPTRANSAAELLFRRARVQARAASPPLDLYLREYVAAEELTTNPDEALAEFRSVFNSIPDIAARDTESTTLVARNYMQFRLAGNALDAFLARRQWDDSISLARQYQPPRGYSKAGMYDSLLRAAAGYLPPDRQLSLVQECVRSDGSFPFGGALALLRTGKLLPEQRQAVFAMGLRASAQDTPASTRLMVEFLEAALTDQPQLATQVEDAGAALLRRLAAAQGRTRENNARAASGLFALLRRLDPAAAQRFAAAFPDFAAPPAPAAPQLSLSTSAEGTAAFGPAPALSATDKLVETSRTDPGAALQAAQNLSDRLQKFVALVALAQALTQTNPPLAAQAADSANLLLDADTLAASAGWPVTLALAFQHLGDHAHAEGVISQCLDHLDDLGQRLSDLWDDHSGFELASQWGATELALIPIATTYERAGLIDSSLALRHADRIHSRILSAVVLSRIAAGMAQKDSAGNPQP